MYIYIYIYIYDVFFISKGGCPLKMTTFFGLKLGSMQVSLGRKKLGNCQFGYQRSKSGLGELPADPTGSDRATAWPSSG